jgi:hypothetical protein
VESGEEVNRPSNIIQSGHGFDLANGRSKMLVGRYGRLPASSVVCCAV